MGDDSVLMTHPYSSYDLAMLGLHGRDASGFKEFKREDIEQSITDRFEQQVIQNPARLAIKAGNHKFTYDSLNKAANRIARFILAKCDTGEEPIALLLEHGTKAIAAILGVLKAGKIYVPLDPLNSHERNLHMLQDSKSYILLTDSRILSLAEELSDKGIEVMNIDDIDTSISGENLNTQISPDAIAYIHYTSGSTGRPKGVVHNHRNVLHTVMKYTNSIHIGVNDRLSLLPSLGFGASVPDMYGALLNGASLFPYDLREEGLAGLANWLTREEITIYHSVPTVFRHFVRTLTGKEKFPKLRLIKLCGESVYKKDVELYKRYFGRNCILHIGLGSTEMNIIRQFFFDHQTNLKEHIVPVGYGVEDTDVFLIDNDGKDVVVSDRVGEIVIKSPFLALGYWRDPELTRAKFPSDTPAGDVRKYFTGDLGYVRPDGCLVLLGRKDSQVKIRGNRIDTPEVETAILEIDGIRESVVVAMEDQNGEQHLIAYIVTEGNEIPSVGTLRRLLLQKLPDYMVPTAFVLLEVVPLTQNGKVDHGALPTPDLSKQVAEEIFIPPRTPLETQIAEVWQEVLGVDHVGLDDNFFDIGGHSLLLIEVADKLESLTGIRIHPIVMMSKTLRELASACQEKTSRPPTSGQVTLGDRVHNAITGALSRIRKK